MALTSEMFGATQVTQKSLFDLLLSGGHCQVLGWSDRSVVSPAFKMETDSAQITALKKEAVGLCSVSVVRNVVGRWIVVEGS